MTRFWCTALYLTVAVALLFGGVGAILADDPQPGKYDPINTYTNAKNCRTFATQCVTLALKQCYNIANSNDGGYCSNCGFTDGAGKAMAAAGFYVMDIRVLGFCATPEPKELINGCDWQESPVECAWYSCWDATQTVGGTTTCVMQLNGPAYRLVYWNVSGQIYVPLSSNETGGG
jgi:hypothetical protein